MLIIVAVVIFIVGVGLAIPLLRRSESKHGVTVVNVDGRNKVAGPAGCSGCLASALLVIAILVPAVLIMISVTHH